MSAFDTSCSRFTSTMRAVADWKNTYFGAAYSTRLKQAVSDARDACSQLEKELAEQGEPL